MFDCGSARLALKVARSQVAAAAATLLSVSDALLRGEANFDDWLRALWRENGARAALVAVERNEDLRGHLDN